MFDEITPAVENSPSKDKEAVPAELGSGFGAVSPPKFKVLQPKTDMKDPATSLRKAVIILLVILVVVGLGVVLWLAYRVWYHVPEVELDFEPIKPSAEFTKVNSEEDSLSNKETQIKADLAPISDPPATTDELDQVADPAEVDQASDPAEVDQFLEKLENEVQLKENDQLELEEEVIDTDNDGLSDQEELGLGSSFRSPDTDLDGLSDYEELKVYQTDPNLKDTDGDGYLDGEEVKNGYNPLGEGVLETKQ